ncbi:MAG: TRAP transporter substrate-binding protein [Azospirillaceae bacterium]
MTDQVRIAGAAIAVMAAGIGAPAMAQTELSLAHFMPPSHTMHVGVFEPLVEMVAEATGGDVTVAIYPAGELGAGPVQQYNRAVDGVADLAFGLQGYTSSVFPRTLVTELPGLFDDAFDGVDTIWENFDLLAPDYDQVHVLGVWFNSPAVLATNTPVDSIDDLSGMTIRAPSALAAAVLEAWGANAVTMPATEIYNALQTGVIDGVFIGPDGVQGFRLYEVAEYVTYGLPSGLTSFFLVANRDSWEALDAEDQEAIDGIAGHALSRMATEAYDAAGARARAALEEDATTEIIDLTPEAAAAFAEPLEGVYQQVAADLEAAGIDGQTLIDALRN